MKQSKLRVEDSNGKALRSNQPLKKGTEDESENPEGVGILQQPYKWIAQTAPADPQSQVL